MKYILPEQFIALGCLWVVSAASSRHRVRVYEAPGAFIERISAILMTHTLPAAACYSLNRRIAYLPQVSPSFVSLTSSSQTACPSKPQVTLVPTVEHSHF